MASRSAKGRKVYRLTCRVCGGPKRRSIGKVCDPCRFHIARRSDAASNPGRALVRRLHELQLRASAGLPLFP